MLITSEDIFCDFVHHTTLDVDLDEIKNKCYTFRKTLPRGNRSNRNGWQSKVLTTGLNSLQDTVHDFITRALNTIRVKDSYYWININNDLSYNVIHQHCRTDLIAIVYITAPIDSGNLVVHRNDGSTYSKLYMKTTDPKYSLAWSHTPKAGEIILLPGHVWHHVEPNNTKEDRISISFNITCE